MIPLLGFTYLLTIAGPSEEESFIAFTIFQGVRAGLLSTQGAVITLPYCFLNAEVQGVLKQHWERWKMIRNVGFERQSTRTSLAHSAVYSAQDSGESSQLRISTPRAESQSPGVRVGNQSLLSVPPAISKSASKVTVSSEMCQPLTEQTGICESDYL